MRPFTVAVATLFFFVVYVEAGGCPFHNHDTPRPTDAYQLMTAAQKQEYLWNQVTANTRNRKWYSLFEEAHIYTEDMGTTFSAQQDFPLPKGHTLYIHTVGWVGQFRYVPVAANNTYTGAFRGAEHGLVRFSFGGKPTKDGIIPASAWKFLRDGVPSANLFAMVGLRPLKNFDFFQPVFTNHLPRDQPGSFAGGVLQVKFKATTPCDMSLGLAPLSNYTEAGTKEANMEFPFQVFLSPQISFPNEYPQNWTASFASIAAGTHLYQVHALSSPSAKPLHIGDLYSTSEFVPSWFGDTNLFFEHARMEDDFALRPEWKSQAYDALCSGIY